MPSMRVLLATSPNLPEPTRDLISRGGEPAREELLRLGVNECEAAELLDEPPPPNAHCD